MKTITIKQEGMGRYDDVSPFLVENGRLEISFRLPRQSGEFYFVPALNGKALGARLIPSDGILALEELEAGELTAEVKHYLRGTLIQVYKVEPLILINVDAGLSGTPEITALRENDSAIAEQIKDLLKRLETTEERAEKAEEKLKSLGKAFLSFAYAEYGGDVQLNAKSLSLIEFMKELGYWPGEFSEEEIEEIKKAKESF